jgi:hypothetical protein
MTALLDRATVAIALLVRRSSSARSRAMMVSSSRLICVSAGA